MVVKKKSHKRAESSDVSKIKKQTSELTQELTRLNKFIKEMNGRYVPYVGDEIDLALADFINSSYDNDKMKVMFIRLSEGVYQFGSKKVFI